MRFVPKFSKKYTHKAIKISDCKTVVRGAGGYRSAIAISQKHFMPLYFEAQIENDEGYARIGVATLGSELNGPVGIDSQGYSYGNKNGYGFHRSRRIAFGERFGKNDILSVYLYKDRRDTILEFFINGNKMNKRFEKIRQDEYWPAVSLFSGCAVSANFGPYFAYETKAKAEAGKPSEDRCPEGDGTQKS